MTGLGRAAASDIRREPNAPRRRASVAGRRHAATNGSAATATRLPPARLAWYSWASAAVMSLARSPGLAIRAQPTLAVTLHWPRSPRSIWCASTASRRRSPASYRVRHRGRDDDAEALAAVAAEHVGLARRRAQHARNGAEHLVAGRVAEHLAELPEAIDVDQHHAEHAGKLLAQAQRTCCSR